MDAAARIDAAFRRFDGWTYDKDDPHVPAPTHPTGDDTRDRLPGVPRGVPLAYEPAQRRTSCSPLTAWCVLSALDDLRADPEVWKAINIWEGYDRWSPIDHLVKRHGRSEAIVGRWLPGWYLTQTWGRFPHSRLVEVLPADEGLLVREASLSAGRVREHLEAPDAWRRWGDETRAVRLG